MAHYKYDRLSAQDNDFLLWEGPTLPMHGGATNIFAAGSLAKDGGGIDFETIKRGIEGILHKIPRYRQKLAWIPGERHAVWVDDPHFKLDYHLRHTSVPRPGSEAQLKQLAARVVERPLDRSRPLWEIWVVEGLEGGRFATIGKTHHCMVDGMAGVDLAQNLLSNTPEYRINEAPRFVPRPRPSDAELRREGMRRLAGMPLRALRELGAFVANTENPVGEALTRLRGLGQLAWWKAMPTSETPLNGPVGPHRGFDWLTLSLADIKAIRRALGCSVNDVVLGIVTGAVRDFMIRRQVHPEEIEFRVASPVNVRSREERGRAGNRVSSWIVRLPIGEADPLKQVEEIRRTTQELKESQQAAAIELVQAIHEWFPIDIQSWATGTQNMFVSNIPGPQFPLYLLGAELLEIYVQPPLIENLGLVVGVISYNQKVCWGFLADYDRVPDLADFVALVRHSFERLAAAAEARIEGVRPPEIRADSDGSSSKLPHHDAGEPAPHASNSRGT